MIMKRLPIGIEDFKELIEKSITMWINKCLSKMFMEEKVGPIYKTAPVW